MDFPEHAHRAGLGAQARAIAIGAQRVAAIAAQKHAHVQPVFFAFQPLKKSVHSHVAGFCVALEHLILLRGAQISEGNVHGDLIGAREFSQFHKHGAVARLVLWLNRAFVERFAAIGNYQIDIEIDRVSKSLAARASAIGIVEREQPRFGLLVDRAAGLALEAFVENHSFGCRVRNFRNKFEGALSAPRPSCGNRFPRNPRDASASRDL